jgi:hypothetical protein
MFYYLVGFILSLASFGGLFYGFHQMVPPVVRVIEVNEEINEEIEWPPVVNIRDYVGQRVCLHYAYHVFHQMCDNLPSRTGSNAIDARLTLTLPVWDMTVNPNLFAAFVWQSDHCKF